MKIISERQNIKGINKNIRVLLSNIFVYLYNKIASVKLNFGKKLIWLFKNFTGLFFLSLVIFLFHNFSAIAANPIILNDSINEIELTGKNYEIFKDSTLKLTINDINSPKIKFLNSEEGFNYSKNPHIAYWIKIKISDSSSIDNKWVLEFYSVNTDNVQVFVPNAKGGYRKNEAGMQFPFNKRKYKLSNFVFDLPSGLNNQPVYVRIHSHNTVGIEFKVRSQSYFTSYAVKEYYLLGFYYGILFIMAIYNFFLFLNIRERPYLFYVLYVLSCMLSSFAEDGLGFQFLWPSIASWNNPFNNFIWGIVLLISFILYTTSFLELRKTSFIFYKIIWSFTIIYLATFILQFIFPSYLPYDLYILPYIAVYIIAILQFNRGFKAARYFILGHTFVFISMIIFQLRHYSIIEPNIFTVYTFNFGIVLEVVVLSFALGDRLKIMREDKELTSKNLIYQLEENQRLQEKVNKELEEKVNLRTKELNEKKQELEEANEKLKKYSEDLNKIASKLDKDNWELNKKIVEETKARIISKELSLEEFSKIFPNDFTCMKYLEEAKWGEKFECKKCNNTKFTTTSKLHTRKCTRCNYIESVTSSTVFHGLKFPLHKAFYIAYLTISKNNKYTINELSDKLQINPLTCSKFRKKVMEREAEIRKKSSNTKLDIWQLLLH